MKAPRKGSHWVLLGVDHSTESRVYQRGQLRVLSSCTYMQLPQQREGMTGLTHHVSVSQAGGAMVPDSELLRVRRDFGMLDAEEDNHHPGRARHLMMPDDPRYRVSCECKADEAVIVTDGYVWTNPKDATPSTCQGCEYEGISGRPCPIHNVRSENA